jgi:hypothetical protein
MKDGSARSAARVRYTACAKYFIVVQEATAVSGGGSAIWRRYINRALKRDMDVVGM